MINNQPSNQNTGGTTSLSKLNLDAENLSHISKIALEAVHAVEVGSPPSIETASIRSALLSSAHGEIIKQRALIHQNESTGLVSIHTLMVTNHPDDLPESDDDAPYLVTLDLFPCEYIGRGEQYDVYRLTPKNWVLRISQYGYQDSSKAIDNIVYNFGLLSNYNLSPNLLARFSINQTECFLVQCVVGETIASILNKRELNQHEEDLFLELVQNLVSHSLCLSDLFAANFMIGSIEGGPVRAYVTDPDQVTDTLQPGEVASFFMNYIGDYKDWRNSKTFFDQRLFPLLKSLEEQAWPE